jgi:hypothetical protein
MASMHLGGLPRRKKEIKKWPGNRPLPEFGGGRKPPPAEFTLTGAQVDRAPLRS